MTYEAFMVWEDPSNPVFIETVTGLPDPEEWSSAMTDGDADAPSGLYMVEVDTGEIFDLDLNQKRWRRRTYDAPATPQKETPT
jgi:hypothetical protein